MPQWPRGDDTKIEYQQDNPKNPTSKSYERYERYKVSKTIREAKANGAGSADFNHDYARGLLKILAKQDGDAAGTSGVSKAAAKQPASGTAKSGAAAKAKSSAESKAAKASSKATESSAEGKTAKASSKATESSAEGKVAKASSKGTAQASDQTSEAADAPQKSTNNNRKSSAETQAAASGSKRKSSATGTTAAESSMTASSSSSSAALQKFNPEGCWFFLPSMRSNTVEFRDTAAVQEPQAVQPASKKSRTTTADKGDGKGKEKQRKTFGLRSMRRRKERAAGEGEEKKEKKDKKSKKHKKDKKDKKSKKDKKHKKEKKDKAETKGDKMSDEEKSPTAKTSSQTQKNASALSRKRSASAMAPGNGSGTSAPGKGAASPVSKASAPDKGGAATPRSGTATPRSGAAASVAAVAKAAAKLLGPAKAKSPVAAAAATAAKAKPEAAASTNAVKAPPLAAAAASAPGGPALQKAPATAGKSKALPPASAAAFAAKAPPKAAATASGASSTNSAASRLSTTPPPKAAAAGDVQELQRMIDKLDESGFDRVLNFLTAAAGLKGSGQESTYTVSLDSLSSEKLKGLTRLLQEEHAKMAKASPPNIPGHSPKALLAAAAQRHREAAARLAQEEQAAQALTQPAALHPSAAPLQPSRPILQQGVAPPAPGAHTFQGFLGDTGAAAMMLQAQARQPPLSYQGVHGVRSKGSFQPLPQQLQPGQLPYGHGLTQPPLYRGASSWDAQAHMPGVPQVATTQLHPSQTGCGQLHEGWSRPDAQHIDGWSLHPGLASSGSSAPLNQSAGMSLEQPRGYPSGMGNRISIGVPAARCEDLMYFGDGGGWVRGAGPSSNHQAPRILPGDTNPPGPCDERCNCGQSAGVQLRQGALDKPWVDEARRKAVAQSMHNFGSHAGVITRGKVSRQHRFQPAAPGWHERQEAAKHRASLNASAPIVVAPDDGTPTR